MKQVNKSISILTLLCLSIIPQLFAQNFNLLDINKSKDAYPRNYSLFDYQYDFLNGPSQYAVLNGISYFSANDGINGNEIWRSDGTPGGTHMLKDINAGASSSNPYAVTVSGNKVYFRADDGVHGFELWVSDGTPGGTKLVKDINPSTGSFPTFLTNVNGVLYFFVDYSPTVASQLWKTDGSDAGTVQVADFYSPDFNYSYAANQLTNVNGRLYFVLNGYSDAELWTSDGTSAGTAKVKDINPFGSSNPYSLTPYHGALYFSADDGYGRKLWVSNGTDAGTRLVNNVNSVNLYDDAANNVFNKFAIVQNKLYMSGYSPDNDGSELCSFDESNINNSIQVIKDFNPGNPSHNLYNLTNVNGKLFFTVYVGGQDQALWKSDGTTAGTVQVKDMNPDGSNIYLFKSFVNAGGTLLFSFYDDAHGYEIWKSDGTETGTVMIKEINPGIYSAAISNITYLGGTLALFEATDGKNGDELWRTDGTEAGTLMVKDMDKTSTSSSNPGWLTASSDGSKLFCQATNNQNGTEIWISDGSPTGTKLLRDIVAGAFNSNPGNIISLNNTTYFIAGILDTTFPNTSDDYLLNRLIKTDGTKAGTSLISVPVLESELNGSAYVSGVYKTTNLFYLLLFNYVNYQYELWRSDGTSAGTYAVKTDLSPYYAIFLIPSGNSLFFTNYDDTYGNELWVSDGTTAGTHITKDINPGFNSANPYNIYAFNGKVYFNATDLNYQTYTWGSDGTAAGTRPLKKTLNASAMLGVANNKLFFSAYTVNQGVELWATDGTTAGTKPVKDIWSGAGSGNPYNGVSTGSLVYFIGYEPVNGQELWCSDGTTAGTKLVKDITPGYAGSDIFYQTNVNGILSFIYQDALWRSDGTTDGTLPVNDANLAGVTGLWNLTAAGSKLFLTGYAPATGQELYAGSVEAAAVKQTTVADVQVANKPSLINSIYPNPAKGVLNVKIAQSNNNDLKLAVTDLSGKTILARQLAKNETLVQLNIAHISAGTYFLKIQSADGKVNDVMKFVKE